MKLPFDAGDALNQAAEAASTAYQVVRASVPTALAIVVALLLLRVVSSMAARIVSLALIVLATYLLWHFWPNITAALSAG